MLLYFRISSSLLVASTSYAVQMLSSLLADGGHWDTEGTNYLFEVTVLETVWGQSSEVVTCEIVSFFLCSTAS